MLFTRTNDCRQISNIRRGSKSLKTIPAMVLETKLNDSKFDLLILALNYSSPITRLTMEGLTLCARGLMSEEEFVKVCLEDLPVVYKSNTTVADMFKRMTSLRDEEYEGEISLILNEDTLTAVLKQLRKEGNLSFTCTQEVVEAHTVRDLDEVTEEYLMELLGDTYEVKMAEISSNADYIGHRASYFYPEDWFVNRGYRYLSYLNSISGGSYETYETLKHAFITDEHFRENPDFFYTTYCSCGSELVIRTNNGEYTVTSCINPFCYEKIAFALSDFSQALGIQGLGPGSMLDLVRSISLMNLEIEGDASATLRKVLRPESADFLGNSNSELWYQFLEAIRTYKGTVKNFIEHINLPYIAGDASKILTGEVLKDFELTPSRLAKVASAQGKRDRKFVLNMWLNLPDLRYVILELAEFINLNVVDELLIYITNGVMLEMDDGTRVKYTKRSFEALVNQTLEESGLDTVRLKVNGSLTHKCNVLIADQGRDTGSCMNAESWGIPIMTSREFLHYLGGGQIE